MVIPMWVYEYCIMIVTIAENNVSNVLIFNDVKIYTVIKCEKNSVIKVIMDLIKYSSALFIIRCQ